MIAHDRLLPTFWFLSLRSNAFDCDAVRCEVTFDSRAGLLFAQCELDFTLRSSVSKNAVTIFVTLIRRKWC